MKILKEYNLKDSQERDWQLLLIDNYEEYCKHDDYPNYFGVEDGLLNIIYDRFDKEHLITNSSDFDRTKLTERELFLDLSSIPAEMDRNILGEWEWYFSIPNILQLDNIKRYNQKYTIMILGLKKDNTDIDREDFINYYFDEWDRSIISCFLPLE